MTRRVCGRSWKLGSLHIDTSSKSVSRRGVGGIIVVKLRTLLIVNTMLSAVEVSRKLSISLSGQLEVLMWPWLFVD
jgi:hypothetical protein